MYKNTKNNSCNFYLTFSWMSCPVKTLGGGGGCTKKETLFLLMVCSGVSLLFSFFPLLGGAERGSLLRPSPVPQGRRRRDDDGGENGSAGSTPPLLLEGAVMFCAQWMRCVEDAEGVSYVLFSHKCIFYIPKKIYARIWQERQIPLPAP